MISFIAGFVPLNTKMEQTTWKNFPTDTEGVVGFVYLIRNNHPDAINGKRFYLGQKTLLKKKRTKRKTKKGTTVNRISYVDNDVEKYWGSSKELLRDIEKYGIEHFSREVIEVCHSKFHMSYAETQWQFNCKALFDNRFYNSIVNCRLGVIPKNYVDIERDPAILKL
jgi:hypothetical protein